MSKLICVFAGQTSRSVVMLRLNYGTWTAVGSGILKHIKIMLVTFCWLLLVMLVFYRPQHILGHFRRGQLTYPHCSWASLLGSLPVLSAHSFTHNWQLPFLNQCKGENGHRNDFMTKLHVRMMWDVRIESTTVHLPGGRRSDRATAPGDFLLRHVTLTFTNNSAITLLFSCTEQYISNVNYVPFIFYTLWM